ncbi:MAG: Eco47II family restriction endonuclease, partial [Vampirovibrionales bacterium]
GYFHQNIFKYISTDWQVPNNGYDVINEQKQIYGEIKNKHNTMNSSSSAKTYMKMQSTIMNNNSAKCYLIEVLAKRSQDKPWKVSIENESFSDKRIRRISMDKFYELVTGDSFAFKKLCEVLP